MNQSLNLLNETLAGLKVEDTQVFTAILEALSELYSKLNQAKAHDQSYKLLFSEPE